MKLDELQTALLAAARADRPSEAVPYAFEKRIMAHIAASKPTDTWVIWNRVLWRAAAPCLAVVVMLSFWSYLSLGSPGAGETLAADLENVVLAPFELTEEAW